jgi:hypothetical protein
MKEKPKTAEPANLVEEEEEYYPVYNLWIDTLTINMAEGSVVNINTGRPKDPKPPVP